MTSNKVKVPLNCWCSHIPGVLAACRIYWFVWRELCSTICLFIGWQVCEHFRNKSEWTL